MNTPIDDFMKRIPTTTHEVAFLFAEPAADIVADSIGEGFADAPPESADYRPAEVEALACWNCAHFQRTGVGDDNWPVGLCHLFEAKVEGEAVCDKFTADATMSPWPPHKHDGEESGGADVEEYSADSSHLVEIFFSSEDDDDLEVDDTGLVTKAILRTGEWKKTPSSKGVIRKPLKIIRDGISSAKDRVISLQEIVDNFNDGAYANVPIPLTDEENKDHKNLLRLNTGWVKKLWIKDLPNGVSKLMSGMQFTEPDARDKIKRGTYPDVSSGIFFGIERPDGKRFNSALNHVVITHKPFMDGLGGFQFSDNDGDNPDEIESLVLADGEPSSNDVGWDDDLTDEQRREKVQLAVDEEIPLKLEGSDTNSYVVKTLKGDTALIFSDAGEVEFEAQFSLEEGEVKLSSTEDWQLREIEASQEDEEPDEPAASSESTVPRNETPLQRAQRRRQARHDNDSNGGGVRQMGKSKVRDISEVDFSDAKDAEKYAVELADENKRLGKSSDEQDLEKRVEELKEAGFGEMPGALAYYRDIFLSDDGEVAAVLLSHDDDGNETGSKKSLSATELIDGFIASIPTDKEGKILLSGQALDTGNHEKPPEVELSDEDEKADPEKVEERTQAMGKKLGVDLGGSESDKKKEE